MAKQPARWMRIWLDEFALSSELSSAALQLQQALAQIDTFGDAGPRRVVDNYDFTLPFLGFLEPTDDGYDEQIHALLESASDHYVTLAIGAGAAPTVGDVAYDALARLSAQPRSAQTGGAILLNFDLAGSGGLSRGALLGSKTSAGAENLGGVNMGATAAGAVFRAIFRLIAFSGTNITLTVEQSQNDGAGDAYAAITGVNSGALTAPGVVAAQATAATEAWKRLAITGTFSSALVAVSAGVVVG